MGKMRTPLKKLEKTGALQLLLILSKRGELSVSELRATIDCSWEAARGALRTLKEFGLVQDELEKVRFTARKIYFLTDKGKRVAKNLEEMERILLEE